MSSYFDTECARILAIAPVACWVYIMSNESYDKNGILKRKIGKSARRDLDIRRKENGKHEGVPEAFIIEDAYWIENGNQIEDFAHLMFDDFRASPKTQDKSNTRSEFFTLPDKELRKLKIYLASQFRCIKYNPLTKYTPEDLPGFNEKNEDAEQSSKKQKKQKTIDPIAVNAETIRDDSSVDSSTEETIVVAREEINIQTIVDDVQDLSISDVTEIDKTKKKRTRTCSKKQEFDKSNPLNLPDGTEIVTVRNGVEMRVVYLNKEFYESGTNNHWKDGNAVAREHIKRVGGLTYGGYNWTNTFKYADPVSGELLKIKEKVNYL